MGLGIQSYMNINEVLVNCVSEIFKGKCGEKKFVYLNDYVNCGQFFNDVFFMVMYIVIVEQVESDFLLVFIYLCDVFEVK